MLAKVYPEQGEDCCQDREKIMFFLGVGYAANIGGTGTIPAEAPNMILKVRTTRSNFLNCAPNKCKCNLIQTENCRSYSTPGFPPRLT